jgi:hypothetical protein
MPTISPKAVVIMASPMFAASNSGFPMPPKPIFWNALIIPLTVPSSPHMGASWAMMDK